ncbi:MAG: hypothetical protein C4530_01030 [Desulfobacteraceae bacterium]|nr:MAG: hypothetical protein C4530_01030 [Desulfobacteraceae bacterium]
MTHTLHRRTIVEGFKDDYTMLCMAAQGYNDRGAGESLKEIYRLVASSGPDNLADDNQGGRHTGLTDEAILNRMGDKAYVGAAFSDKERLKEALMKIRDADLGMSVVVSGNYPSVFGILKELDLKPHTVNMSLGIFGDKKRLPQKEVLTVATMCGHGMVPPRRIEAMGEEVKRGECSAQEGGRRLAATCTCGIFNPKVAGKVIEKLNGKGD